MSRASDRVVAAIRAESPGGYTEGADPVSAMLDKDVEHARPLGARNAFSRMALALVEAAGDEIRTTIAGPEYKQAFCTSVLAGLRVGDRTVMNMYPRLLKMVDEEKQLIIALWDNLGVSGHDEARRKIEMAQSVEGMGPHDGADRCLEYLSAYLSAYPDRRHAIVRRLGGVTEVLSSDYRVVEPS